MKFPPKYVGGIVLDFPQSKNCIVSPLQSSQVKQFLLTWLTIFALKQLEKNPWVFGCTEGGFCECGGAWDVGTTSFSLINLW
jgi:hypothetical protein